ncbi:MAG: 50S ribosomal protein L22 [Minisyncoccia bacterium]
MNATAQLSNYRQSPRKVARVADLVRGKAVSRALAELDALPKRAAGPLHKLIKSAAANARGKGMSEESLVISKITVGKGLVMKRRAPKARGQSALIRKKASHISVELSERKPARTSPQSV